MSNESMKSVLENSNELAGAGADKKEEYVPHYHKRTLPAWVELR